MSYIGLIEGVSADNRKDLKYMMKIFEIEVKKIRNLNGQICFHIIGVINNWNEDD